MREAERRLEQVLGTRVRIKDRKGLTVITTSLPIASELQYCQSIETLLLGGFLRHGAPDLAGSLTESNLENLRADIAFIGADGIDSQGNVYNRSMPVGRMLAKMAASADKVFVVADHSKLGRTALMRYGNIARWSGLITDRNAENGALSALRRAGAHVIRAT